MSVKQLISRPEGLQNIEFDEELDKILLIAAHVGDKSGDQTLCSYTSILIGFLWSDDATSVWLQNFFSEKNVKTGLIYQHRGIRGGAKNEIVKLVGRSEPPSRKVEDTFSRSARTMLGNAVAVSQETGLTSGPLGARHLMAAYVFRNPSSHDRDLRQWGIEDQTREAWKYQFTTFIIKEYETEAQQWEEVLKGYLPEHLAKSGLTHPGSILGSYKFSGPALAIARLTESHARKQTPQILTSEQLLFVLLGAGGQGADPDCQDLKRSVQSATELQSRFDEFFGSDGVDPWPEAPSPFVREGSRYGVSRGLKRILDRARTVALSTTRADRIGVRHVIAAMLIADDSTACQHLVAAHVPISPLRQELLKQFIHRWINDDPGEWRLVLIGVTPPTLAGFDSDASTGDDQLDVTRYATAFATVMAATGVTPPLSIGVFGDWGSGKSFFMHLMRQQTKRVCGLTDLDDAGERLFCRRVLPIEFNAWHYAESNLWASLVQTIFTELHKAMVPEKANDLLNGLRLAKESREEAEQRLKEAKSKEEAADNEVTRIRGEVKNKQEASKKISSRDLMTALQMEVLTGSDVDGALDAAESYLGIKDAKNVKKNFGDVMEFVSGAKVAAARTRSTWGWLGQAQIRGKLIAAALLTLIMGIFAAWLLWGSLKDVMSPIKAVFAEAGVILTVVVARALPLLDKVKQGLKRIDGVRRRIETIESERSAEYSTELEAAQITLERAQSELGRAEPRLAAAKAEVQRAEDEVKESSSTRRIARLIERRLEGKDYEKYLGIVAAVREDFQFLSEQLCAARLEAESEAEEADELFKSIDRIVLYIDDLDRCPSEKVVSVLEAIHLILAFPLFVVVVGVDIRWAGKSLHERYPAHLDADLADNKAENEPPLAQPYSASALDYLEKIFQIPFWLPPMEEDASHTMLGALVPPVGPAAAVAEADAGLPTQAPPTTSTTTASAIAEAKERVGKAPEATVAGSAEALRIELYEREFLLSLAGAVGKSPRRLKRFVNTYRILKASCHALERKDFVVDNGIGGTYRAAMTLLAITTGAPASAVDVLGCIDSMNDEDELQELDRRVEGRIGKGKDEEIGYIQRALQAYRKALGDPEPKLSDLRYWGPRVVRFSFRSGRLHRY